MFRLPTTALLTALTCSGCGSSTPPAPTPQVPAATVRSIAIEASAEVVTVGNAITLKATATLTDGTTKAVSPAWTSSTAAFDVDAGGQARAVSAGTSTIVARFESLAASLTLRARPEFTGTWRGQWEHESFVSVDPPGCLRVIVGDRGLLELTATQEGDLVNGTLNLSGVRSDIAGTIDVEGTLRLTGRNAAGDVLMRDWATRRSDDGLSGTFTWIVRQGAGTITCQLSDRLVGVSQR